MNFETDSEILASHGYVLRAYAIQRSIKDQIWILCAAANKMASFGELFGWNGMGVKWSQEDKDRVLKKRVQTEKIIQAKLSGEESGLSERARKELLHWERLFNWEAHRGLFSFLRASDQLINQKKCDLVLGPCQDDLSDGMFLNRSMELNWLTLRLLPFMRRSDTPLNEDWSDRWNLMEASFQFTFNGFSELGKAIAPAFEALMNAKFKFNTGTYYADPEEREGKGSPNSFMP